MNTEGTLFGLNLPQKKFTPGDQIRLWKITYLDDELRILRARRPETAESESFIFILIREKEQGQGI